MPHVNPFEPVEEEIDYSKLIKEFGTQPISTVKELPDYRTFRRGLVFSHRDFDKFMAAVRAKKRTTILTGFNASGSIHLGHKLTFDTVIALQKKYGIDVMIPISDDESLVTGKIKDQQEGLRNARLIAAQMVALGFDMKRTQIFIHQMYTRIYNLAIRLSTRCTLSEVRAIYGFDMSTNPGLWFYPLVQAADILLPQELYGPHHTLVPIGIDQDPHVRLARDLADKVGLIKPSAIHIQYLRGLKGGKMSTSKPGSAILMDEKPEAAAKLCMQALTGGQATVEEQRRLGGDPEKSVVIEYLGAHFIDDDKQLQKLKDDYRAGKLLDGEVKRMLADNVKSYLTDFQKKVAAVEKDIDKYLMK